MSSRAQDRWVKGRRGVLRLLRSLLADHHEAQRFVDTLRQYERARGTLGPYQDWLCFGERLVAATMEDAAALRRRLDVEGTGIAVDADRVSAWRDRRRTLHRVLRRLPRGLARYAPAPDVDPQAERFAIAKVESQGVPDTPHPEDALLQLPTPWLKAVARWHGLRGHRARLRIAASIADVLLYDGGYVESLVGTLDGVPLRLLARHVAAGRRRWSALSAAEADAFAVPGDWDRVAEGEGGRLRQYGLLFVGREGRERTVYVPEGLRPTLAPCLAARLQHGESPEDRKLAEDLDRLGRPETERRERERPRLAGPGHGPGRLPTRLSRIRHRTPGPDRVFEIVATLRGAERVLTRRVLVSYQRSFGALREILQLALGIRRPWSFLRFQDGVGATERDFIWTNPAVRGTSRDVRDEWAIPLREAFQDYGHRLTYEYRASTAASDDWIHEVRMVRVHAPEHVAVEPCVVYGEGLPPHAVASGVEGPLQARLDAANRLLARL